MRHGIETLAFSKRQKGQEDIDLRHTGSIDVTRSLALWEFPHTRPHAVLHAILAAAYAETGTIYNHLDDEQAL